MGNYVTVLFILGVSLNIYGLVSIKNKQTRFGRSPQMFKFEGTSAIILGVSMIFSGLVALLPALHNIINKSKALSDDELSFAMMISLFSTTGGFILTLVFDLAIKFGETLENDKTSESMQKNKAKK